MPVVMSALSERLYPCGCDTQCGKSPSQTRESSDRLSVQVPLLASRTQHGSFQAQNRVW